MSYCARVFCVRGHRAFGQRGKRVSIVNERACRVATGHVVTSSQNGYGYPTDGSLIKCLIDCFRIGEIHHKIIFINTNTPMNSRVRWVDMLFRCCCRHRCCCWTYRLSVDSHRPVDNCPNGNRSRCSGASAETDSRGRSADSESPSPDRPDRRQSVDSRRVLCRTYVKQKCVCVCVHEAVRRMTRLLKGTCGMMVIATNCLCT